IASNAFPHAEIDSLIERDKAQLGRRNTYEIRPELVNGDGQPQISYSAELAVATKEFGRARNSMEEILDRHRGYTAKLRMIGQPAGSTLSATLRVPSSEYSSAVSELKAIGNLERDEEAADEVVQQRGDLEARLLNAQNAERRIQKLIGEGDSKGSAAPELTRQLSELHADIDRLEAERRSLSDRAVFSNIYFSLREERVAPVESFSGELRSAAVSGLS